MSTNNNPQLVTEPFGCCSSYRACSDARRCVISDRDYSALCMYRKNLEAGRIFYGKNADRFSASAYAEFLEKYQRLSPDEQLEFQAIVGLFVYWRLGSVEELLYVTPGILHMAEAGLFKLKRDPLRVLSLFNMRYIKARFGVTDIPDGLSREKAIEFLAAQNPDTAQEITDSMGYVKVSFDMRTYYVEFYQDFMECESQPPKPGLPLEEDNPHILKEFRRTPIGRNI